MSLSGVIKRLGLWILLAGFLFLALATLFGDLGKVTALLKGMPPKLICYAILAVLFNYLLRFLKWTFFLRLIGVSVPTGQSLWIFLSAFTMVLSPGKLGEVMKSVLLKARYGLPVSRTAPVVLAERVTDLLGLFLLSIIGSSRFAFGGKTVAGVGLLLFSGVFLMTRASFWSWIDTAILAKVQRLGKLRGSFRVLEESTKNLLSPLSLLVSVPLSAVSWAGEGVALWLIFQALNVEIPELAGVSIFSHAFSSIVGALSFLPGGLMVTEGTLGVFFVFVGIGRDQAVSATLLIRALTLWLAVILGTVVFLAGHRPGDLSLLDRKAEPQPPSGSESPPPLDSPQRDKGH